MPYQVRISLKALEDVEDALRWFRDQRAIEAGARWYQRLLAKVSTLEVHPGRCSLAAEAEELGLELRELLFGRRQGKYRILFVIDGQKVQIVRIFHGARDALHKDDL